jgi:ubiquinone/menaquinone biosynthesis C-methylase UbiE
MTDLLEHNRKAWNEEAKKGNIWTLPASKDDIEAARKGQVKIVLTPQKPVPRDWLGDIRDKEVLCLASGGGQQGPILAAGGANVTVFDNSDQQLKSDRDTAEEHQLEIKTVQGNMQDLECFSDSSFDLIIHPVSNCFIDDILPVWKESCRVLKEGGALLSGFSNPLIYMIDWEEQEKTGLMKLVHSLPYSDLSSLSPEMKKKFIEERNPFEFGHTLADQIQGQIEAGFVITGFYEDKGEPSLDRLTSIFLATRAEKLAPR